MSGNKIKIKKPSKSESGFSLVEASIAMTILLISMLAIFGLYTLAVTYNTGNSRRSQALSILQQEIELIRSAKFTPTLYNDPLLTGGTKSPKPVTSQGDNNEYMVETIVDNDPFTAGVQTANDDTTKLKEITITVTPQSTSGKWITAYKTAVVMRRTRAN